MEIDAQLFPAEPSPAGPLFAVLDGARDEAIDRITVGFAMRQLYLIDGVEDPELARVAPRVVELGHTRSTGAERLREQGRGRSWGYYLRSRAPLLDVRDHLASLLVAELPDGSKVRFRLFDPRVLGIYLPTCSPAELERVFGPVECFLLEREDPSAPLECFARDAAGELSSEVVPTEAEQSPWSAPRELAPLELREAQLEAFTLRARGGFEARALVHLRRFFPAQCEALGEAETREVLALGVARAASYGFVTEVEVCKYLNLMFSFGREFDTQQGWARTLLRASSRGDEARMERLYALALVNEARALGRV